MSILFFLERSKLTILNFRWKKINNEHNKHNEPNEQYKHFITINTVNTIKVL